MALAAVPSMPTTADATVETADFSEWVTQGPHGSVVYLNLLVIVLFDEGVIV